MPESLQGAEWGLGSIFGQKERSGGFGGVIKKLADRIKTADGRKTANANGVNSDLTDFLAALGIDPTGLGSGSSSSWSSTPVAPPVVDILGEMRARRTAEAEQAVNIAEILGANLPAAMENYPGFEMGGLADVLLGIITGEGAGAGQQVLPQEQRRVNRVGIPVPKEGQPGVEEDAGVANALAQQILDAIRVIQTGGSSSSSSG